MNPLAEENTGPRKPRKFWGYASASMGISILRQIILFMAMYFYCPPSGKGTTYLLSRSVGLALALGRLIDVLSDPIVGYMSDHTQHKWGKRLPYIIYGLPIWIIATVLIFTPPGAGPGRLNFFYLAAMASVFFIGMTVVQIPYTAVLPEIAWHEDEAVQLSSRMGKFFILGALIIMVGGWWVGGKLGFFWSALIFSLVAVVPFVFAIRELFSVEQRPVIRKHQGFWKSALFIIRHRPFWTYLVGHSLFICGYYTMLVACPYFATEIVGLPREFTSVFFLLPLVTAIAVTPLVERSAVKFGKKPVMLFAMALYAVVASLWFFIGRGDTGSGATLATLWTNGPEWVNNVSLAVLGQGLLMFTLVGISVSVQMLIPMAIVSDLVIYDERQGGERRESLVYGLQGGIEKNAVMVATVLVSVALAKGKAAGDSDGIYLVGPIAALLTAIGCAVFLLYPLKKGWQEKKEVSG